ncbi:hypothetical protein K466DRAFT_45137 [Polyporus arcularius HHB13444]|uniref:F-box domain-containing protein n=1 Tax=Polyporus arcularius HHB13444 TaxID=1314778 RepID=A0A5C3PSB2_9APHY|nr:hypothetical protein K466DRAFT_45137 [Polyporus arcularius HHB13444]
MADFYPSSSSPAAAVRHRPPKLAIRTLTDLPVELLHLIIAHMEGNKYHDVTSFDPFLQFLRRYPRVAKTVVSVRLRGRAQRKVTETSPTTSIDDTVVGSIVELLPRLESLALYSFHYTMSPVASATKRPSGPFPLIKVTIGGHCHKDSSLTCTLRVLSLFTPRCMDLHTLDRFDLDAPFEPRFLHRRLALRQLSLSAPIFGVREHTALALQALSVSLKSDSLQELCVQVDSKEAVAALGKLLSYAGCNITTLAIATTFCNWKYDRWVDPFEGKSHCLDVSMCKKLESITLPMVYRANPSRPLSAAPVAILEQTPRTLRSIIVKVQGLLKSTMIGNKSVFEMHAFDKLLTPARFPHLQAFELHIYADRMLWTEKNYWPRCVKSARSALNSLNNRGLLKVKQRW